MVTPGDPIAVLVVDDDEDDFVIARNLLAGQEQARFEVEWCSAFEDALGAIRQRRHDVYLIDYRLGERTGLELVRDAFDSRAHAPVIMLTGHSDYEVDLAATAAGVTDYLLKAELDPRMLERSIRYAISHHQALSDLARSEERYALAVRATNDGIWDWDLESDRIYLSPRWHAILGHPSKASDEPLSAWFDLVHAQDVPRLRAAIDAHLAGRTPHLESEHRMRHADGSWLWVLTRGLAIRDATGSVSRVAGSLSDINDRHVAEVQLQHDALHDALTGLPNRPLFMDRIHQVLQRATRDPALGCAVLFLDVDRFKLVNDSLSHAVGDQLLVALAKRIDDVLRPGDTVARLGGDEFTILLDAVADARDATVVAERVQTALADPFRVDGNELRVTASLGIALSSGSISESDLLRNADIAMYDAKRRGGGRIAIFDQSMHQRVVKRVARENDLRHAVEQSLLEVHFQPIVALQTGRLYGIEALARWPDQWPEVAPLEFVTIAEETGVIGALGVQVMTLALDALAAWRSAGLVAEDVCMSVNLSGRQLDDPGLPDTIARVLAAAGLPPNALRLEITESTLMQEPTRVRRIVTALSATGVRLHLDDFGTGYSSLSALYQFPVDVLKIDRSFVASGDGPARVDGGVGSEAIVRSIVALAHGLGLGVIAEGIERPDQLEWLRRLGCEYGQGFLFSRPMSLGDAEAALTTWSPEAVLAGGEQAVGA